MFALAEMQPAPPQRSVSSRNASLPANTASCGNSRHRRSIRGPSPELSFVPAITLGVGVQQPADQLRREADHRLRGHVVEEQPQPASPMRSISSAKKRNSPSSVTPL